jgi:hypothetical protein
MGLGVVILATSRPYEGLLACFPVAGCVAWWFFRDRRQALKNKVVGWLLPVGAVCAIGGIAIATYNQAVTGDWRELPYSLHQRQYFHQNVLCFHEIREPERVPVDRIAKYYLAARTAARRGRDAVAYISESLILRARLFLAFGFSGLKGTSDYKQEVALCALPLVVVLAGCTRWSLFCWLTIGSTLLGEALVWTWFPHYSAPIYPLLFACMANGLRRLERLARSKLGDRFAMQGLVLGIAVVWSIEANGRSAARNLYAKLSPPAHDSRFDEQILSRAGVLERLQSEPGRHLVFVRYDDAYTLNDEWVYNGPDLEAATVLFAHDLGSERNPRLIERHRDRRVWFATVADQTKRLTPYCDAP